MWEMDKHLKKHFFHFLGDAHGAKVVIGRIGAKKKRQVASRKEGRNLSLGRKWKKKRGLP